MLTPSDIAPANRARWNGGRLALSVLAGVIFLGAGLMAPALLASGATASGALVALVALGAGIGGLRLFRGAIRRPEVAPRRTWSSQNLPWRRAEGVFSMVVIVPLVEALVGWGAALLLAAPLASGGVGALNGQGLRSMALGPIVLAGVAMVLVGAGLQTGSYVIALPVTGTIVLAVAGGLVLAGFGLGRLARRLAFAVRPTVASANAVPASVETTLGRELWSATDQLRAPLIERVYLASPEGDAEWHREAALLTAAGYQVTDIADEWRDFGTTVRVVTFAKSAV